MLRTCARSGNLHRGLRLLHESLPHLDGATSLVQLDWAGLANNRLVASVLYNWVMPPDFDLGQKINAYSVLARYYLGDWSAVNVSLHAELQHRVTGDAVKTTENLGALMLDFAF